MKLLHLQPHTLALSVGLLVLSYSPALKAEDLLTSTDPIIAFDEDFSSNSSYPDGEAPGNILDKDANTKYLNFGISGSGFIVTPAAGASAVRSFRLTTANDSPERDPASIMLYGTNEAIVSADNSSGDGEMWTEIHASDFTLSDDRLAVGDFVNFTNDESYTSYRVFFPTLKGAANSMQIAEVEFWDDADGGGTSLLNVGDVVLAVDLPSGESASPGAEGVIFLIDGDSATKYLNFGRENAGFIVTPAAGSSVVTSFTITTANDAEDRDPANWELYGTNEAIVSETNSDGMGELWTLIAVGTLDLPFDRQTKSDPVIFENRMAYTSYKWLARTLRNFNAVDSIQIAEFQFECSIILPLVVQNIEYDLVENLVTLEWSAQPGPYTLLYSSDLVDWSTEVANFLDPSDDSPYTFTNPVAAGGKGFFRFIPTETR